MPDSYTSSSRPSASQLIVFTISYLAYLAYVLTSFLGKLPVDPSANGWKLFVSVCSIPLLLLILFMFRRPHALWTDISRFVDVSTEIRLIATLIIPTIFLARISELLQQAYLGYSVKLDYALIGLVGFQYLYFPMVALIAFCFTSLFLASFPIANVAKKILSLAYDIRTYYDLVSTTTFFLSFLTGISDIAKLSGVETPVSNPFVIPFTPTMWIEYLTLDLVLLPVFILIFYFLSPKPPRTLRTRTSILQWAFYLSALIYFIISEGARFGLSQIWIFGSICAYWGIAVGVNIVGHKRV